MSLGLYGKGMHDFVLSEAELGYRAAVHLDEAGVEPDGWFYDILYMQAFGSLKVTEEGFQILSEPESLD